MSQDHSNEPHQQNNHTHIHTTPTQNLNTSQPQHNNNNQQQPSIWHTQTLSAWASCAGILEATACLSSSTVVAMDTVMSPLTAPLSFISNCSAAALIFGGRRFGGVPRSPVLDHGLLERTTLPKSCNAKVDTTAVPLKRFPHCWFRCGGRPPLHALRHAVSHRFQAQVGPHQGR